MPVKNLQKTGEPLLSSFATRSALLMTGNFVKLAVQLAILVLYSRLLPVAEYGKYQSVWLFVNVFGVITLFGLPSLLLSLGITHVSNWVKANKTTVLPAVTVLHLLPVTYLLFGTSGFNLHTALLLFALMLAQNFSIIRETLAVKHNRPKQLLIVQIIFNAGWLYCHLFVVKNTYSLPLLLSLLTGLCIVKGFALGGYKVGTNTGITVLATNIGKQWTYLGLFDLVGVLFKWIDKWVILLFISVTQFAIYYNGSYEIPFFPLMVSAAGSIMVVELTAKPVVEMNATSLFKKCMRYLAIPVFPAFFFLLFYHEPIFLWVFGEKYAAAIPIFLVTLFVIPVRICHFTAGLQAIHRNDIVVKGAFLDLALAILLMLIFYPLFDLPGLALSFVISTWAQAAYYLYHTARLMNQSIISFIPLQHLAVVVSISFLTTFVGKFGLSYWFHEPLLAGVFLCAVLILIFIAVIFKKESRASR